MGHVGRRTAARARAAALCALAAVAGLAACSGERGRAARAFADAMAALGVRGATWSEAVVDPGGGVALRDASGTLVGSGSVRAAIASADGFVSVDGRWSSRTMEFMGVSGAVEARRITMGAPEGDGVGVRVAALMAEGPSGPLAGVRFGADAARAAPGPDGGLTIGAEGVAARDAATLPAPFRALATPGWTLRAGYSVPYPNTVRVDIRELSGPAGEVGGTASFRVPPGRGPAALSGLTFADVLDAGRWPEGVEISDLDVRLVLASAPAGLPDGGSFHEGPSRDALRAMATTTGPFAWRVRIEPRRPVPVRDFPAMLARADGAEALGLRIEPMDGRQNPGGIGAMPGGGAGTPVPPPPVR